jgi:hypothetical protein
MLGPTGKLPNEGTSGVMRSGGSVAARALASRWYRPAMLGVIGGIFFILVWEVGFLAANSVYTIAAIGTDFNLYRVATHEWLATGQFYPAWQLDGPYLLSIDRPGILYPPVVLVLLAPFAFLPDSIAMLAWWVVPLATTVVIVGAWRPALWAVAIMLACVAWSGSVSLILFGNPMLWTMAVVALGTRFGWPFVLVLFKPTLAPFAVLGVRRKSWWLVLAIGAVSLLAFGSLWRDWLTILANARGPLVNLAYSAHDVPLMLVPLVAWLGRNKRPTLSQPTQPKTLDALQGSPTLA